MEPKPPAAAEKIYPFRYLWGLLAVLALMALVFGAGPYSDDIAFIQNTDVLWYYWQLPESTTLGFVSAWTCYLIHQVGNWWIIARAKRQRRSYVRGLRPLNLGALVFNAVFILLHIVQTQIWYDGLAQNFSPLVAQFSVIFLLVIVLLMENPRRGLWFGKKAPVKQEIVEFLKRYHGYYFSLAIVFTFWFHPIEINAGHLLGFFYMFLLLMQGSLIFTTFHTNRRWTTFLESFVLLHAMIVAYLSPLQSMTAVAMFGFGFLTIFVVTQIYGLGLSRRWIAAISAAYLLLVIAFYWGDPLGASAVLRIPIVQYFFAFATALLVWMALLLGQRFSTTRVAR